MANPPTSLQLYIYCVWHPKTMELQVGYMREEPAFPRAQQGRHPRWHNFVPLRSEFNNPSQGKFPLGWYGRDFPES